MTADLTPQGTPWQAGPPDPAVSRWWWVEWIEHRASGEPETFVGVGTIDKFGTLGTRGTIYTSLHCDWPEGWRCAPVLAVAEAREQGRRETVEECDAYLGRVEQAHLRGDPESLEALAIKTAAMGMRETVRAFIPAAPRPEPPREAPAGLGAFGAVRVNLTGSRPMAPPFLPGEVEAPALAKCETCRCLVPGPAVDDEAMRQARSRIEAAASEADNEAVRLAGIEDGLVAQGRAEGYRGALRLLDAGRGAEAVDADA